ncbi:MAG: type II toxin-antitoxin system RelE/ParE family toxin [Deltaproteobacteria bacterium]|nr:type II toxin-antitoxin system RelE/ParE family toxin [Deltaproteobacteria bacterium]
MTDELFLKIDRAILSLKNDPFPHPQSEKLKGEDSRRLRVGDYRIVYTVDIADKILTIYKIRHRRDAYR